MAKFSENKIPSAEEDWGYDPLTGLPYSGEAVQAFIKEQLENRPTEEATDKKVLDKVFGGGDKSIVTGIEATSEMLRVTTVNSEGEERTTDFDIANPDTNDRLVTVSALLSNPFINLGGQSVINYGVNITDYQGDNVASADGTATAILEVSRKGSAVPFYSNSLGSVELAAQVGVLNQSADLTSILRKSITDSATVIVTLTVNYTYSYEKDGLIETKTITKYATAELTVLNLTLTTNISIDTAHSGQVGIPFTVKGNGSKSVYLYINGKEVDSITGITSNTFSGNFSDNISSRGSNRVNYQIVAKAAAGDTEVSSSSFYFDLFTGTSSPVICFKVEDGTGAIQEAGYNTPVFNAAKFSEFEVEYYVYDPVQTRVPLTIICKELDVDGRELSNITWDQTVNRRKQLYNKKIKTSHQLKIEFKTDSVVREFTINPMASTVDIELPIDSLVLNLDADGRSNQESDPASWNYGGYTTQFQGINWESTGWREDNGVALFLQNGAKATIDFPLFSTINGKTAKEGCAFELTFKCDNATLEENDIISCYWKNNDGKDVGLKVTTSYVGVNTGHVTAFHGDNDVVSEIEDRVGSQYAQGEYYKYMFVINPNLGKNGLCLGFLNGILSFVSEVPNVFVNADRLPIVIDSTHADIYIKSIKYYNEPFTYDQAVDSFIVDKGEISEIESAYSDNDVMAEDSVGNLYVSPAKLRNMGRGVMIISPSEKQTTRTYLQDLNKSDNKKTYYGPFRIDYFAPEYDLNLDGSKEPPAKGNKFNFTHFEAAMRIQGTTSTKRPRKNYRINFNKRTADEKPSAGSFIVGGEINDSFKYAMSANSKAVPIACLKVDYVDSSMVHNTGGAVIFNEITKQVAELRNPAQIAEFNGSVSDIKTRVAIEGFPIDVFAADEIVNGAVTDTLEDSNYRNLVYMGQYNYNNDKSKSGSVFGFDGAYTYDENGYQGGEYQPICIEFLDNQSKLDNFQVQFDGGGDIDEFATYAEDAFNKALEVRAPEDVTDIVADEGGLDALKNSQWEYIEQGIKRVFNFVGECAKEVAQKNGISPTKLNTWTVKEDGRNYLDTLDWTSEKFAAEAEDFFNMYSVCAWYIWTDYMIAVDQRAKNMMLYTMDGKHWMFQYYDGDTVLGERNDCFLAYDYLTDRNTYDESAGQFAMQGHDSWLWYLVRANFDALLKTTCNLMRKSGKFSSDYLNQILNGQFVNSWSERQYNYSQDYKYIQPLTETGFPSSIATNYINTAQGSREAHRTYTINNRFRLLDSKYAVEYYLEDGFSVYGSTDVPSNKITIVSSIPYFFGWNTPNTPLQQHQEANADNNYTVVLNVTGIGTNNPATILGASRIKELIFDPTAAWTMQNNAPVSLPNLERLIAKDMSEGRGTPILNGNPLLKYIDFSGSNFSGEIVGLEDSGKLQYVNVENTNITGVPVADGCPLETLKLATPTAIYLSNLNYIRYNNSASDTLTAQDWSKLDTLSINNCPNVDWIKLVSKLSASTATNKYLKITGINETKALSWLDQFETFRGLSGDGHADLSGTLQLVEYTDDDAVEVARAKYPSLTIKQPEYTLIELDETVTDETGYSTDACCVSNLDNETGLIYGTPYEPSGHISKIFKNTHRYLGKLVSPGKEVIGNPFVNGFEPLKMRDASGILKCIQLADEDSRYYNTDYESYKIEADLSGLEGKGETFSVLPKFWYKGINYNTPLGARPNEISKRYTAFSSAEDQPEVSSEIKVVKIANLLENPVSPTVTDGLIRANGYLVYTNESGHIDDRLSSNNSYDVVRVSVQGFKKVRYPMIYQGACSLFTDREGNIIEVNGTVQTKNGVGSGEVYCVSNKYGCNGMPLIATVPEGSVYFYITVPKYITGTVSAQPCDIVLHKGTKFLNGDAMNEDNAREWIADMEPEWCQSPILPIAAAECAVDATTLGIYSPFDGKKTALRGSKYQENALNSKLDWFQHRFSLAAFNRGLMLVDYEATKILALLFTAKYGRRNSQNVLGGGSHTVGRALGATRQYGMTDSMLPDYTSKPDNEGKVPYAYFPTKSSTGSVSYTNVGSNNFLGVENISGNVLEWMDRVFLVNENADNLGKLRIIMPDLTERKVFASTPSGNYPSSIVHGKNCDICSCSPVAGGTQLGYSDYQNFPTSTYGSWEQVRAVGRSSRNAGVDGGVFYLYGNYSVACSHDSCGSRLMFRGNVQFTTDIEEFENTQEWRG